MTKRTYLVVLTTLSILSLCTHLRHLDVNRMSPGDGATPFWATGPDARCYLRNADALRNDAAFITVFKERLMLPTLINVARAFHNEPMAYLYLAQLFHVAMPWALACLSYVLFRNRYLALATAALYLLYDPAFDQSEVISTDFVHSLFFMISIAITALFLRTYRTVHLAGSALMWSGTMLCRPTFLNIALILAPLLAAYAWCDGLPIRKACALVALLCLVPLLLAVSNGRQFGVFTPTFNGAENIHTVFVPSIWTSIRDRTEPDRNSADIWHEERDLKAMAEPTYTALRLWENYRPADGAEKTAFAGNFKKLKHDDRVVVMAHVKECMSIVVNEVSRLLFQSRNVLVFGERWKMAQDQLPKCLSGFSALALLLLLFSYRQRGAALMLIAVLGFVCVTSATFLWSSARFMLPVDLVCLVLAPAMFASPARLTVALLFLLIWKGLNVLVMWPLMNFGVVLCLMAMAMAYREKSTTGAMERIRNPLRGFRYAHL